MVVVVVVRVRPRHVVRGERRQVAGARGLVGVRVVRVMPGVVMRRGGQGVLSLDLLGSLSEHGDVHGVLLLSLGSVRQPVAVGIQARRLWHSVRSVRVGRGDVGRGHCRGGSGADGLGSGRRGHHVGLHAMDGARVVLMVVLVVFVALPRVGVVVYPRMAGQLVGAREFLAAAGELAGMRLLSRVRPDVPSLVLEAVEGLVAQRALVRARQLGRGLSSLPSRQRAVWSDDADGGHVYVVFLLLLWLLRLLRSALLFPSKRCSSGSGSGVVVQQI